MTAYNLEKVFRPNSIAVVGASPEQGRPGQVLWNNIVSAGFDKPIYPVNYRHRKINGTTCYHSLGDIRSPVDLAVIVTPIKTVPEILRDGLNVGLKAAVLISSSGEYHDDPGGNIAVELEALARDSGIRLIGPNSLGVISTHYLLNACMGGSIPLSGRLAFISQSRGVAASVLDWIRAEKIGLSHLISVGNGPDVDLADLIDYLSDSPRVDGILLYLESLHRVRKFMSAARAAARNKPLVVLRPQSSSGGVNQADNAVYNAAFERAGLIRVPSVEALFDAADIMSRKTKRRGPNLAVITNAAGPGLMAADERSIWNIEAPDLTPATRERLTEILPGGWDRNGVIDLQGDAPPDRYAQIIDICMSAKEIHALVVIYCPPAIIDPALVAKALVNHLPLSNFPVFPVWMGGEKASQGRKILAEAGLPVFTSPERAVRAFRTLHHHARNLELLREVPDKFPHALRVDREAATDFIHRAVEIGHHQLDEEKSGQLLASYGLPLDEFSSTAAPPELVDYYFGVKRAPHFGPIIIFGLGGPITGALPDRSLGLPPLNRLLARRMVEAAPFYLFLMETGRLSDMDRMALEEFLVKLSRLIADFSEVNVVELNPVNVFQGKIRCSKSRIIIQPEHAERHAHLIISPYPNQYETTVVTKGGVRIFIRPIRPEDVPLLLDMHNSLSDRTIYFRFCHTMRKLSPEMLSKFTQIDYDRETALVAIDADAAEEKMLGVARTINNFDGQSAELAIVVRDEYHGRGVGACLMERCMEITLARGVKQLCAYILPENRVMRALTRKLGWTCPRPGDEYHYYQAPEPFTKESHNEATESEAS